MELARDQPGKAIAKVNYTHMACVDAILANPGISQGALAAMFGYSEPWMSRVIGSDAFQEYLAQRKKELVDPILVETIEERMRGVMIQSMEVVSKKLATAPTAEFALKALELSSRALGYGAKPAAGGVQVNQQFVIHAPAKSADAKEWLENHGPSQPGQPGVSLLTGVPLGLGLDTTVLDAQPV